MGVRSVVFVSGLCVASLLRWQPLRTVEETLAPVGEAMAAVVGLMAPAPASIGPQGAAASQAQGAWSSFTADVLDRPPPTEPGHRPVMVPVLSVDAARHELTVAASHGSLVAGTPVTYRRVLLGFVRPGRNGSDPVDADGRARVALIGHPEARPVAAEWKAGPDAAAVHFLLHSERGLPEVTNLSRALHAVPGQLAWTRDVARLGDDLPAGLLLGSLASPESDQPGGGRVAALGPPRRVDPLLDPARLGFVVVEARADVPVRVRQRPARVLGDEVAAARLRIDRGRVHGVEIGDEVVQDSRFIGRVEVAGPFTSVVRVGVPHGELLVLDADEQLVPTMLDRKGWPPDWTPRTGRPVFAGHRQLGGLHVGYVGRVEADRFTVVPAVLDPTAAVTVLER